MDKIFVRDLQPSYNWTWSGCSFRWKFEGGSEDFGFEKTEKDFVEYIIPEWQRGHVWTEQQQIEYIEYCFTNPLQGGSATEIIIAEQYYNSDTPEDFHVKIYLVDGLQRTTAVRRFLKGEIKAFGRFHHEYEMRGCVDFRVHMLKVNSEEEAMKLYLSLNGTGTPHTKDELDNVRDMLNKGGKE
ncbi:MAG: DUF262 domain-containing protein [Proteobacteria bacterium]|nr:DUF262 domain-containing protein [Pseudomonadota bacterium]